MQPPRILEEMTTDFLRHLSDTPHQSYYRYDLASIKKTLHRMNTYFSEQFFCRYAMKANSNQSILHLVKDAGIGIDACSEQEVNLARNAGFPISRIQLSSQQAPQSWKNLYQAGVDCVVTSLHQLKDFCQAVPGGDVGIRVNPGQGSGQYAKINTGGVTSSFGIRHEYIPDALHIAQQAHVNITKLHIHIGSGTDLATRRNTFSYCLRIIPQFPDVTVLNMGGGFKVGRMPDEKSVDLFHFLKDILPTLATYNEQSSRTILLEIEPGSFFVANHGYLISQADDIVDTGSKGHTFVKTTTGMDMLLRPALYHAQHPFYHYSLKNRRWSLPGAFSYVFVGHCCESTDLLTPNELGNIGTRGFDQQIERGDMIVIGGCGAYCESLRCLGYNGFW